MRIAVRSFVALAIALAVVLLVAPGDSTPSQDGPVSDDAVADARIGGGSLDAEVHSLQESPMPSDGVTRSGDAIAVEPPPVAAVIPDVDAGEAESPAPGDPAEGSDDPAEDPADPADEPADPGDDPPGSGDEPDDPADTPTDPGEEPADPGADPGDDPDAPAEPPSTPAAPGVVTAVTCVSGDMTDIVRFDLPDDGGDVSAIVLSRALSPEGPYEEVRSADGGVREIRHAVESTGTAYYRVHAEGPGGQGENSAIVRNAVVEATAEVGVDGYTIRSSNGEIVLAFPAGAYEETTTVNVREVSGSPVGGILAFAGIYDIEPSGPLGKPVLLSVAFDLAVTHFQVSDALLRAAGLFTFDDGAWVSGADHIIAEGGYITGSVDHFSAWTPGSPSPHGTNAEASDYCSGVCHDLSTYPGSSVRYDTRDPQVCYNCHGNADAADPPRSGEGDNVQAEFFDVAGQSVPAMSSRHPVANGGFYCTLCHDPHGTSSDSPGLLRAWDPATGGYVQGGAGTAPGNAYCWTCHGPSSNRRVNYYVNGYYSSTGGDHKTLLEGTPHASLSTTGGTIACLACHVSHGSVSSSLAKVGDVAGAAATGNDQSLCLACHADASGGYSGGAAYGMTRHSSVAVSSVAATGWPTSDSATGSCQNCHDPHGGAGGQYLRASGADLCHGCHDVAGLSYPADYSYQGTAAYGASGHAGLTGTLGYLGLSTTSEGFAAWQSSAMPTPSAPGTPITDAGAIDQVRSMDGSRLRTLLQGTTGSDDYQMFRFKVPAPSAEVVNATLRWAGYGEETAGYPVTLSVWSATALAWEQAASQVMGTQQLVTVPLRPADHMDAEGYVYFLAGARHVVDGELISGPTFTKVSDTSIKVEWTTAGNTSSWVDYGTTTAYGSSAGTGTRTTSHSVTVTGLTAGTWHFRVRSTSPQGEDYVSGDYAYGFPMPKLTTPYPASHVYDGTTVSRSFYWEAMSGAAGPYEYRFQLWRDGSLLIDAPWGSYTSYTYSDIRDVASYAWRVEVRDAQGLSYGWSVWHRFYVYEDSGSCPFLFTWDGERFAFEADLFGPGKLALKTKSGYMKPTPDDVYVLAHEPQLVDGRIDLRLVEERFETDYLDELALYAIDVPEGRDVYAEKREAGGAAFGGVTSVLHTVAREMASPVSAVHTQTGRDVLALVAADDGEQVVLNEDRNEDFTYQTIELDLGEVAGAGQLKVVMDAVSMFPDTPAGTARASTFGPRTRLEVQDAAGAWVAVPASAGALPKPPEFSRPYVFDLSDIWVSESRKVRFTFLMKTYVDWIAIDTTEDLPVAVTEVPLASAVLTERGYDPKSSDGEIYEYVYGEPSGRTGYFPGAYTRLGEVAPLLAATDDMFVIYGGGDELQLSFETPDAPADGTSRRYAVHTNGYYKDAKTDVDTTVEPLPFAAMSTFPYGADEHYPDDPEHEAYRAEWNTRVKSGGASVVAQIAGPASLVPRLTGVHGWVGAALATVSADVEPVAEIAGSADTVAVEGYPVDHRSLNTDLVSLDVSFTGAAGGGECGVCHNVHGGSESGIALDGGRAASDGRTCTADGTGGCHSNAANSASGIDIHDRFTANADPRAHHDVFASDQVKTGSRIGCADCHDPHTNNSEQRYSDPDAISQPVSSALGSLIGEDGSVYMLVGAAHDGVPPVISGARLNGAGDQYLSPTITWTTDEKATSWVDWGLTTAYEMGNASAGSPFGNDTLVTAHSVQMTGLQDGVVYHYRIRTADALGNVAYSADMTYVPVAPPAAPVMNDLVSVSGTGWGPITATLGCTPTTSSDGHAVQYQFRVDGSSVYVSGWLDSTSFTTPAWLYTGTHYAQVRARDAVHTDAISAWSAADHFDVLYADASGSCPFLFTWDGERFAFEADLFGPGKLALKTKSGYMKPTPDDVYVLAHEPQLVDGRIDLRLVEERFETDYLDELALYAIDVPEGRDVYAEKREAGGAAFGGVTSVLHTVAREMASPVSAVHTQTGRDVLALVAADDGEQVVLNEDRNEDFTYQTIELDLGEVAGAGQLKVVMDAVSMFPDTPAGTARASTFGPRTRLEVQDAAGAWVAVPASAGALPKPPEFSRPYVFDLSDIWVSESRKVRFTFLMKTYVDWIAIDTTEDLPVAVTEVPLASAVLTERGYDPKSSDGEIYEYVYGEPSGRTGYFPGAYTRLGEVAPLLAATDDMFVIYGGGDELQLSFETPDAPADGTSRRYAVHTNGYYKDAKTDVDTTVEPLPFAAMSTFPYGADEHYPDDPEHEAYRAEWNTRVKSGIQGGDAAVAATASASEAAPTVWRTAHVDSAAAPQALQYSVDTDVIRVIAYTDGVPAVHAPAAGWETSSHTASAPTPASPGSPVDAAALGQVSVSDDAYWRTDLTAVDGEWNWQVVRFDLDAGAVYQLDGLALDWEGHGEPTPGYPTALYVWDPESGAWAELSRADMPVDRRVQVQRSAVSDGYCLACHDGDAPEGVVIPGSVGDVGATWATDFHGGRAGNGFGDAGLKFPYSRGQSPLSCATCHDTHGSASLYHVPEVVNGTSVPTITTSGMAPLCKACHEGATYDWHLDTACWCHYVPLWEPVYHDAAFELHDGIDCLQCHGHGKGSTHPAVDCEDCHGSAPRGVRAF
ncbi:cytochrome c3 family protein [Anaerosoma tenue]|uniref:cytochrome c3 family protein n=1 Tax=Anaerosoma tenue TaxID=2933588 RepID=UPI002260CA19|nr:cytochrome c3 family protein [Anaerosoma tenue]MCK8114047.1 hypothetical protein [Anaerosoma tenue]